MSYWEFILSFTDLFSIKFPDEVIGIVDQLDTAKAFQN